jgi:hypothetical protein
MGAGGLTISPPTLDASVECEWKKDQCPSEAQEDKTDSIDLDPPVLGELPPGKTSPLVVDPSVVRRGSDRKNTQLLGLYIRPEQYHEGRSHDHEHNNLRDQR